jgi:hypothetical protein
MPKIEASCESRVSKGFPDVPHAEDYQNLYDCGLGPYWYELDIRGKKLQSIHSVFLALAEKGS